VKIHHLEIARERFDSHRRAAHHPSVKVFHLCISAIIVGHVLQETSGCVEAKTP
jgi:hypothetical protein